MGSDGFAVEDIDLKNGKFSKVFTSFFGAPEVADALEGESSRSGEQHADGRIHVLGIAMDHLRSGKEKKSKKSRRLNSMQRLLGTTTSSRTSKSSPLFKLALSVVAIGTSSSPTLAWCDTPSFSTTSATSSTRSSRLFSSSATAMSSSSCATLQVAQFPCLSDNYGYLIHDAATGQTAAIDTPEAGAYQQELKKRGWTLTHIFNTHHHYDHVGANLDLKNDQVQVYGPASEKIPGMDVPLKDGDEFEFGSTKVKVMDVGGHTLGHIAFYFPDQAKVFAGDSLFALGCGKMFEGTPQQFWKSLTALRELPDDTMVYW